MSLAELEPLRSPRYRTYLLGWTLYNASSWLFYTAMTWTFLQSDGAAAAVAFLPTALVVPVPMALLVSGLVTDRRGPRDVVIAGLLLTAVVMAAAAGLVAMHAFSFGPTLAIGFVTGVATGIVTVPAQVLMLRLVEPRHASGAAGSNLLTTAVARILGGPIGGALVAAWGPVPAFLVAAGGSLAGAVLFASLPRVSGVDARPRRARALDLGRALRWSIRARGVVVVIALDAVVGLLVFPYLSMLSVVARDLVHGTAADLGLLIGAGGVGVALASVGIHLLNRRLSRGRVLLLTLAVSAAGVAGLAATSSLVVALILAAIIAAFTNMFAATENLLVQTMSPVALRGRVLALDGVLFNVANPIGTLSAGLLIGPFGVQAVLLGMAGASVVSATGLVLLRSGILRVGINEAGDLDDPRLAVRAIEPDGERGIPSPVSTPASVVAAVADGLREADGGEKSPPA
jgi:predicted MFS family arabinose efflux permease